MNLYRVPSLFFSYRRKFTELSVFALIFHFGVLALEADEGFESNLRFYLDAKVPVIQTPDRPAVLFKVVNKSIPEDGYDADVIHLTAPQLSYAIYHSDWFQFVTVDTVDTSHSAVFKQRFGGEARLTLDVYAKSLFLGDLSRESEIAYCKGIVVGQPHGEVVRFAEGPHREERRNQSFLGSDSRKIEYLTQIEVPDDASTEQGAVKRVNVIHKEILFTAADYILVIRQQIPEETESQVEPIFGSILDSIFDYREQ